jgi:glyoxylase-like metal-dependent hydrolase (beta-lactamase superfamily II)
MSVPYPAYGVLRQVTAEASVLLEDNPGTMTLDGTNTWVIRAPESPECIVVDPGHLDEPHLDRVLACGPIEMIILTHHHPDHADGAMWLADRANAPIRAFDPKLCSDADPLTDGTISAAGLELRVDHTPGHTDDSICVAISRRGSRAMLTGDTVLGRGTTVVSQLGDYLESLRLLASMSPGTVVLPGHGPERPDLAETARKYLAHREHRLDQVRAALQQLGEDAGPREVVELVYADVDQSLWGPAEWSVRAQLDYIRLHG